MIVVESAGTVVRGIFIDIEIDPEREIRKTKGKDGQRSAIPVAVFERCLELRTVRKLFESMLKLCHEDNILE